MNQTITSHGTPPDSRRIGFFGQWAFVAALAISLIVLACTGAHIAVLGALFVSVAGLVWWQCSLFLQGSGVASDSQLLGMLVADFVVLSLLLCASGGPLSPFGVLMLFPIALSFILLETRYSVALVGISVACLGGLLRLEAPTFENAEHHHIASHLYGMLVALALLACFVSSAIRSLRHALHLREGELQTILQPERDGQRSMGISAAATVFMFFSRPWLQLACVGAACCAAGFFVFPSMFGHHHSHHSSHIDQNVLIMGPVLAATIGFICHLIIQLTRSLRQREQQLYSLKERMHREHLLSSLATLAAGTAHELCSPLMTIAVIAKELERQVTASGAPKRFAEDLHVVSQQVDRCREILDRMNGYADSSTTPVLKGVIFSELMAALEQSIRSRRPTVSLCWDANISSIAAPAGLIDQIAQNLIDNAVDASADGDVVHAIFEQRDDTLAITVRDTGQGMSAHVLERAGEPFFSTKNVGSGSGMGLFIVRSLAGRFGQGFHIDSSEGQGTTVTLELCLDSFADGISQVNTAVANG